MTPHQQAAYDAPCFYAEETNDRRFHSGLIVENRLFTVMLTVNMGHE